ncbi:CRISPR-associated protein Cas5/CasD, subtype TIGR01868 [Thiohalobacter thiocyanaticus]|uniref:CRISPR-associated protein Cas5/CasD, subtype TIGR01868 n=1 Tax=Thiohalobacter thiocyanaticus TaxID=585455 RepID=A0A1Z4VVG1_9GAMM|nr:type I-E CRISPR-associated protein Cas5/CasD [Thiohalobacter thiocyanaticus]BAZ95174.1 CRISPR-associated protein Cas5/CasD, subtype TIGR01868 [Thiohalobacter thiocyanaticus]
MSEYLLLRLYGPLASWGETAVGEVRPSAAWPGRSAIIGLLAAALGIRRDEEARQRELASSLGLAVCVERSGELLRDYHTVQVPPERRGVVYRTRRDELGADRVNTLLSQRDYRTDALYTVALWRTEESPAPTLAQLEEALRRPHFTLYLGRKACPPALPLAPHIVTAANLREAFDRASFPQEPILDLLPESEERIFAWEATDAPGMEALHISPRRDEPTSRRRWQFGERDEYYRSEQMATTGRGE